MQRSRRSGNPSGRKCDLMQANGPRVALGYYYKLHCHALNDLLYNMGLLPREFRNMFDCHFCINRFSSRFLSGTNKDDRLLLLFHHFMLHEEKWLESHPIERFLHILASLVSCYICKGTYPNYMLCKNLIRHRPEEAHQLLEGDWYCRNSQESLYIPGSLQSWCVRTLLKPVLQGLLFEYSAYTTWYEFNRKYRRMKNLNIRKGLHRNIMYVTGSTGFRRYDFVNPRLADHE